MTEPAVRTEEHHAAALAKRSSSPPWWRAPVAALAFVLVAGLAGLLTVGWVGSERALYPEPDEPEHRLAEYRFVVEEIRFPSRDGTPLVGWFVAGRRPETILVVHGFRSSKEDVLPHIDMLSDAGFNVFAIDLRNHGQSGASPTTFGYHERGDVLGAVDYLLSQPQLDPQRIGALGLSMGAASVILAAAEAPAIRAVVAEGSYASLDSVVEVGFEHFLNLPAFPFAPVTVWIAELRTGIQASRVRPIDVVHRLAPRPLLLITGLDSTEVRYQDSIDLFKAAGDPRELWLIPGAHHANGLTVEPDRYRQRVISFFQNALAGQPLSSQAGAASP